ncbi:MAG: outer membrane protein [Beijerinckiaceae bacterium]
MGRAAILTVSLAALAFTAEARAADYSRMVQGPSVASTTDMGGWYLRGDIGYVLPWRPTGDGILPNGVVRTFENERFGNSMMLGLGLGYRLNSWFRADLTAEWRKDYDFSATNSGSNYVNGYSDERAKFSARTFMLNGYVDLGTWSGLTPYIGGGVGVTNKEVKDWSTQVFCFTAFCTPTLAMNTLPDTSKTGASWAVMAGVAWEITPNLSLDIGYRYLSLGEITTNPDSFGVSAKIGDVKINEVKAGFRYKFN